MIIVSEQQAFTKLRIAPADCAAFTDEQWLQYILELRGEREKDRTKEKKPKAPKAPGGVPGRRKAELPSEDWD